MKKFKIVKNKEGKFIIKQKFLFFWDILVGSKDYDTPVECYEYLVETYKEDTYSVYYEGAW